MWHDKHKKAPQEKCRQSNQHYYNKKLIIIVYSKLRVINGLCKIVIIITNIYTHSFIFPQSVWHENSYKDRRFKHCFGLSGPDFAAA